MSEFKFPVGGENVKVVAPNGITYVWDTNNERWAIESQSNITSATVHIGITPPVSSAQGDLWYDTSVPSETKLRIYISVDWVEAAPGWLEFQAVLDSMSKIWYGDAPPTDPTYEFWWDTNLLELCVLHGGMWFPATAIQNDIPSLQEVLENSPAVTTKDIFLTNAADDIIDLSPSEARVVIGTVGEGTAPKFELRHKEGANDSLALFEIDDGGKRLDIEADGHIDNIHFKFANQDKFILNKTGDAEFVGRVKALPGRVDNEVVTYQQLVDLEEEIESISPSLERGEWEYVDDYHLDRIQPGQYFSGTIQTQEVHDAEIAEITQRANDCFAAAGDDPDAQAECTSVYVAEIDALVPTGEIKPTADFSEVTNLIFHKTDSNATAHTFIKVEIGDHISILDEADDDYLVGLVTAIDNSNDDYAVFEINVLQARGEANPGVNVKARFFSISADTDTSDFATKPYVDSAVNQASPIGTIVFWGGVRSKIPTGWTECLGQTAPDSVQALTGRTNIPNLKDYMPAQGGGVFGGSVGTYVDSKIKEHHHTTYRLEPHSTTGDPNAAADSSSSRYRYWRGNSSENGSKGNTVGKVSSDEGDAITAPPVYLGIYIMRVA